MKKTKRGQEAIKKQTKLVLPWQCLLWSS